VAELPAKVLLDTNFLLIPIRFGVDIFAEAERALNQLVEPTVSTGVLKEIESLRKDAGPRFQRELDFARSLTSRCVILEDEPREGETVDDSLVRLASTGNYVVATTDAELRKRLRSIGVKVLLLRQRRYLRLMV
jgi:rRNA-processing protein FCF1